MRLVSKADISRLSNQAQTFESLLELMGRQPHHIGGYIRMKNDKDLTLLKITEMLGNVYMDGKDMTKLKEIDTLSFTWDVDTGQVPTVRFVERCQETGEGYQEFKIYLDGKYFTKYDVLALEDTNQLFVKKEPRRINDQKFEYTVQLITNNPSDQVDTRFTDRNKTARYVYNMNPVISEAIPNIKLYYNLERQINWLTKVRSNIQYDQDLRAREDYFFSADGRASASDFNSPNKIYKLNPLEKQALDHQLVTMNGQLLFGRSVIDPVTQRSVLQEGDHNRDIIAGDGIITQYERVAQRFDYTTLTQKHLIDVIEAIVEKRGKSTGNHITVFCNRQFYRGVNDALTAAVNSIVPNNDGTWFFTKDTYYNKKGQSTNKMKIPNPVAVGASIQTYIYSGNVINFMVDEALTNHYRDRGFALFADTGLFEQQGEQVPAISLHTLKDRAMVRNTIPGIGGVDGRSNGVTSSTLDAGTHSIVSWRGARVANPYAAYILEGQPEL